MKKIILVALLCSVSSSVLAGFMYESELTVTGFRGEGAVENFPVLVRISPSRIQGFRFADCRPDGYDISFVSSDESVTYPHEIESWNLNGESLVWVRVPRISGRSTTFKMLYGDASRTTPSDGRQVWSGATDDASGRYVGVWHLSETTTDGQAAAADSARTLGADFVFDGQPTGYHTSQMVSTDGVVGVGRVNAASKGQNLLLMPAYSRLGVGDSFAFSGWFKADGITQDEGSSNGYPKLFARFGGDWGDGADTFSAQLWNHTRLVCYGFSCTIPDCMEDWVHVAVVYDGQEYAFYANGALVTSGTMTKPAIVDDDLPLRIGGAASYRYSFYGKYDELRLLDAVPSADWFQAEYDTVHDASYLTASPAALRGEDAFYVSANGDAIGTVSPDYGQYEGELREGTVIRCTASTDAVQVSDVLRERIRGWKLFEYEGSGERAETPYDEATTNALDYVHSLGHVRGLEWQVVRMHPVMLEASRAATFTLNGRPAEAGVNWVDEGPLTVTVLRQSGVYGTDYEISGWSGDVGGATVDGTNLSVTVAGPLSLRVSFSSRLYVSATTGVADADGTRDKPFRTVNEGLAAAQPTDAVLVGGGMYAENVVGSGLDRVTIRGGYDPSDWARDLTGHPSIIKPVSGDCFVLRGSSTNVVSGFVLTGGSRGLYLSHVAGNRLDQLVVTNNTQSGVYFEHDLETDKQIDMDFAFTSSYVAGNGRYGVEQKNNDWKLEGKKRFYILNCTITDNALGGVYAQICGVTFVNTVLSGNRGTDFPKRIVYHSYSVSEIRTSCVGTISWPDETVSSTDPVKSGAGPVHFRGGVLRLDPRLAEDGSLRPDSRLIARGEDVATAAYAVTEDVLGRRWNGVYDIGAFKSAASKVHPTVYPRAYVAADGDDDAEGDAPERAVRTVSEGLLRTAPGGTCHVGAGTYELSTALTSPGTTLVGAGREQTVLKPTVAGDIAVSVAAHDVTICNLAVAGAAVGINIETDSVASNTVVSSCLVESNDWGVAYSKDERNAQVVFVNVRGLWVDRSVLRDNRFASLFVWKPGRDVVATSSFLDGCGRAQYGVYSESTRVFQYNTTILSHAICGFYNHAAWGNSHEGHCYNVVFADNAVGWELSNDVQVHGRNCLFDNVVDTKFNTPSYTPADPGFVFAPAGLVMAGPRRGSPTFESPATGGGIAVSELSAPVPVTVDVNGDPFRVRHWDIGCFAGLAPGLMLLVR